MNSITKVIIETHFYMSAISTREPETHKNNKYLTITLLHKNSFEYSVYSTAFIILFVAYNLEKLSECGKLL